MIPARLQQLFEFLNEAPNDEFTLFSIGFEYMNMGDHAKAIEYFSRLKDSSPEYIGTYLHLANTYEKTGNREMAIATFDEGIRMAQQLRERHALSELQSALNEILFED